MKKLIFVVLCSFGGCVASVPEYESPTPISPISGSYFSENIVFEWLPNNKADHTTGDYLFTLQVSKNIDFTDVVYSYSAKVWNTHDADVYHLRNGVYYWRVVATYTQNPSGQKTVKNSLPMSFTYTGNDGAVFVSASAIVGGNGTQLQPVQTISEALFIARKRSLTSIRVANGSYTETISPVFLGSIKACYEATSWVRNTSTCATTANFTAEAIDYYAPFN